MNGSILVAGGDSLVGRNLATLLHQQQLNLISTTRRRQTMSKDRVFLDLSSTPDKFQPPKLISTAVLCAGITNQAVCRRDPAGTRAVNVDATLQLARRLFEQGSFIVFLSTNLVFDGTRPARRADERMCPMTTYGAQKAEVETALRGLAGQWAVVRLTKVFHEGLPILQKWRDALRNGNTITPFADYRCAPVSIDIVTRSIAEIASRRLAGIWQVSASEDMSYAEIATMLARQMHVNPNLVKPVAAPAASVEHLPRFTTLETTRLRDELGITVPQAGATVEAIASQ